MAWSHDSDKPPVSSSRDTSPTIQSVDSIASITTTAGAAAAAPAVVVMLAMLSTLWIVGDVSRELETGGLSESWDHAMRKLGQTRAELVRLPPAVWTAKDAEGTLVAARYV